jgi:hypothetical protein
MGNGLYEVGDTLGSTLAAGIAANLSAMTGSTGFGSALPSGFLNWSYFFKYYKVIRSRIKVTCNPVNAADTPILSIWPALESTALVKAYNGTGGSVSPAGSNAALQAYGHTITCTAYSDTNSTVGNTIRLKMDTAKINGLTNRQFQDDVTNGVLMSTNPNTTAGSQDVDLPWFWFISVGSPINSNFTGNIVLKIELQWDTEMFDPITQDGA